MKKSIYLALIVFSIHFASSTFAMEQEKQNISSISAVSTASEQERPALSANNHYVLGFYSLFDRLPRDIIKLFWLLLKNDPKVVADCWEFADRLNLQGYPHPFEHFVNIDGNRLLTFSNNTCQLWNADGTNITTLTGFDHFRLTATTPDCSKIAIDTPGTTKILDTKNGQFITSVDGTLNWTDTTCLKFSKTGEKLLTSCADKGTRIWNVEDGSLIARLHNYREIVTAAEFNDSGTLVLTESGDETWVWDAQTGLRLATLEGNSAKFNSEFAVLITMDSDQETINIYHARTFQRIRVINLPGNPTRASFTLIGNHISVGPEIDERYWNMVWNLDGERLNLGESAAHCPYDAHFSPRGDKIAVQCASNNVRILNAADHSCSAILAGETGPIECCIWNEQQDAIIIVDENKIMRIWNPVTGERMGSSTFESGDYQIKFECNRQKYHYCSLYTQSGAR